MIKQSKIYENRRIKIKSKIQFYKDKMIRNRMLKILRHRSFKILSYDKNAELNKCVFIFALRTSTRLIHSDITLIRILPLPFHSNSLGEVTYVKKKRRRSYSFLKSGSTLFSYIPHNLSFFQLFREDLTSFLQLVPLFCDSRQVSLSFSRLSMEISSFCKPVIFSVSFVSTVLLFMEGFQLFKFLQKPIVILLSCLQFCSHYKNFFSRLPMFPFRSFSSTEKFVEKLDKLSRLPLVPVS